MENNSTKSIIDKSEHAYMKAADKLLKFFAKEKSDEDLAAILNFQGELARAMYSVSEQNRILNWQRNAIIQNEIASDRDESIRKLKIIDYDQKLLKEVTAIGQILGNSFAWIFYQNQPQQLGQHSNHQISPFLPTGIGGAGEVEFISNIRYFGKHFIVYHGITSILRSGDISLVDLSTGHVSAIGELKTKPSDDPNKLDIQLTIIGEFNEVQSVLKQIPEPTQKGPAILNRGELPTEKMKARFIRQKKTMEAHGLNANKDILSITLPNAETTFGELADIDEALTDGVTVKIISDCLLVILLDLPDPSFYDRLSQNASHELFEGLVKDERTLQHLANRLFIPGRSDNRLEIYTIAPTKDGIPFQQNGMPPILWWPIDGNLRKRILLRKCIATTIYNPAHLYTKLESEGFEKIVRGEKVVFRNRIANRFIELENMQYYHRMISTSFMSLESVVCMIRAFLNVPDPAPDLNCKKQITFLVNAVYKAPLE